MSPPGMGWDTGCVLLAQSGWVLARCWDSSVGESVPHSHAQPRVHLHVQADHPTACTHTPELPQDTLPLHPLPADTYMPLHSHVLSLHGPLPSNTVPVHSCPTALPALVPQDTPHQCTPHHPTACALFSTCSLNHSHVSLLTDPRAPLPQPPLLHSLCWPWCCGARGDPDFWAGRTLGRATGSALGTAASSLGSYDGPQWSVVGPVCSK